MDEKDEYEVAKYIKLGFHKLMLFIIFAMICIAIGTLVITLIYYI